MRKKHPIAETEEVLYDECSDCEKRSVDVTIRADPYAAEINNETVMVQICDFCYSERAADV